MKTCPWNEVLSWIYQTGEWVHRAGADPETNAVHGCALGSATPAVSCGLLPPRAGHCCKISDCMAQQNIHKTLAKSNTWKLASSFSPEECESSVTCVNICTCRACTLTVVITMVVYLKVHVRAAALGLWRSTRIYHCTVYIFYTVDILLTLNAVLFLGTMILLCASPFTYCEWWTVCIRTGDF